MPHYVTCSMKIHDINLCPNSLIFTFFSFQRINQSLVQFAKKHVTSPTLHYHPLEFLPTLPKLLCALYSRMYKRKTSLSLAAIPLRIPDKHRHMDQMCQCQHSSQHCLIILRAPTSVSSGESSAVVECGVTLA